MGGFSNLKGNQATKPSRNYGSRILSVEFFEVEHIPGIINPRENFTKKMKYNIHFRNIRDSMMASLQAFLKYSHNVLTHIIYAKKILPYYSIRSEHIVP